MSAILPQAPKKHLLPLPIAATSHHQDPLVYIDRQAKHIERNLQVLIDAQSEGLLAGLTGPQREGSLSSGSYTPTSDPGSSQRPSTIPIRQPAPEKIGLSAARQGIFSSIYDLLKLREEERELLAYRVDERKDALGDIANFNTRRTGLENAISTIQCGQESQYTVDLREEGRRLEEDIHELETKLSQMRSRHQHVLRELSQMENSVESKLSSYQASLSLLESNIQKYLQNPPVKPQSTISGDATFYTLNPSRRTLGMAQEHWTKEQSGLQTRQREVDAEIEALEAGGGVWKQVVGEVSGFEKRLRTAMRRSMQTQSQLLRPDGPSGSKSEDDLVRTILEDLTHTTGRVEYQLELAESKDWKLLVCCISAELQALHEAQRLLLGVFNVPEADLWPSADNGSEARGHGHADGDTDSQADPLGVDNAEPPADLLRDTDEPSHGTVSRSEDEDDEPDPAWLLPES
ncbi:autophagy-related protein Atg28 [Aspergillus heteromorphus CBS 117.55]|uniref:Autophagy-related protein Atg28 n=1 Tax=Aspergillus heteromorphus CBS 117.55 TaxID=1448321 RepID=A0A317WP25_9EURO|nr:autophagy-related protein Atg28 [Aspergillus heteromorphus CBS 117.55]PWY86020.1 autophagy-related protein Atg28 [Aspergillus heteromorphus CBS 117.55]